MHYEKKLISRSCKNNQFQYFSENIQNFSFLPKIPLKDAILPQAMHQTPQKMRFHHLFWKIIKKNEKIC
jgi:hypothetical protein